MRKATCDAAEHVLLALLSTALLALLSINKALLHTCDAAEHVFLQLSVLAF